MSFTVHVDYRELQSELRKIGDVGLKRELAEANKEIADHIVSKALPRVPVRSGRLKASVRGLGNQSGTVGKAGSTSVPYAAAIHWGRKRGGVIQGRRFLQDAANEVDRSVAETYEKKVMSLFARISHP